MGHTYLEQVVEEAMYNKARKKATIHLTCLDRIQKYTNLYAQEQPQRTVYVRTMTMQPVEGIRNLAFLAPTEAMVKGHKHHSGDQRFTSWAKVTDQQYHDQYLAIVERNMAEITAWYNALPDDAVVLLCCYCRIGTFCHRQFVAKLFQWLRKKPDMPYHEIIAG